MKILLFLLGWGCCVALPWAMLMRWWLKSEAPAKPNERDEQWNQAMWM